MWIRIVHTNQDAWEAELCHAVVRAAERHTGSSGAVQFGIPNTGFPDLVVYLGSPDGAHDISCAHELAQVLARDGRVLPLVRDDQPYGEVMPQLLHEINGQQWSTAEEIAEIILRQLGLTEADRRVFLSYRRVESTPLALQLHDELHRRRFSIFLDRFDIEGGVRVQTRIYEALQEMSFVLLLESREVNSSRWVDEEIGYGIRYDLGLLAVAAPDVPEPPPFIMIPEDKRERLARSDCESDGRLNSGALSRVVLRIEREHADQLLARRERMIQDVSEVLRDTGHPAQRMGPSSLIRSGSSSETIIWVCPRPPASKDFFGLDGERLGRRTNSEGWLVGTKEGYHEGKKIVEWLADSLVRRVLWFVPSELAQAARYRLD